MQLQKQSLYRQLCWQNKDRSRDKSVFLKFVYGKSCHFTKFARRMEHHE